MKSARETRATGFLFFAVAAVVCAWLIPVPAVITDWFAALSVLVGVIGLIVAWLSCLQVTRIVCVLISGATLIVGLIWAGNERSPRLPDALRSEDGEISVVLVADVEAVRSRSPFGWRVDARVDSVDGRRYERFERVLLFVPTEYVDSDGVLPGTELEVFAQIGAFPPGDFPHGFDARRFYRGRGYAAGATALEPPVPLAEHWHWRREPTRWRIGIEDAIISAIGEARAGPLLALITGTRGYMKPEYRQPFVETGTAHLLAISGLHLGILAALFWLACGALIVRLAPRLCERYGRRRVCGLVVLMILAVYVAAIGAPVSAVRSWCAVAVGVGALLTMRAFCALHALAVAALAAVVLQPSVVHELGFQLSFSATLGILLFLEWRPRWLETSRVPWQDESRMRAWMRRAGLYVGLSVSASLATWPALLAHFGVVSTSGLWVNLVATPVFGTFVFPAVLVLTVLGCIAPTLGPWAFGAASALLEAVRQPLAVIAETPHSELILGVPSPLFLVVCVGSVLLICVSRGRALRLAIGIAGLALVVVAGGPGRPTDAIRVHFVPVGQGDATLVEFPDGQAMLIDAGGRRMGPDPGRRLVVPYLKRLGIQRLDWLVITHSDWDHLGGAPAVVDAYSPEHLVLDALDDMPALQELEAMAVRAGAEVIAIRDAVSPDSLRGVQIVRPDPVIEASGNDRSLIVMVREERVDALFAGDIELIGENWLRARHEVRSTLLKMPHHGSRTSSSPRFLDAVEPVVAVSSSGRNHYFGHPHREVVERYARRGIGVFGTHRHGLVVVDLRLDGRVEIRPFRGGVDPGG